MLSSFLFLIWRFVEIIALIPPIGMLSYFIHGFVASNLLTPDFILVLFIVVVLAGVWALATLVFYYSAKQSGFFLAFMDLCIFAALIAGVVVLRGIAGANCKDPQAFNEGYFGQQLAPFIFSPSKSCNLLKASFAFGIMNIIFFFNTFILALLVHRHNRKNETTQTKHYSRHSHRRTGSSRSGGGGGNYRSSSRYDDRRRGSSRQPSRSRGHSRPRSYV